MTETAMRQNLLKDEDILSYFRFNDLSKDFERELVSTRKKIKRELEHELLMDIHQYSVHASVFYKNMFVYIQNKLAEEKQLEYYLDKVRQMYWDQLQQEQQARIKHSLVDYNGRVLDSFVM